MFSAAKDQQLSVEECGLKIVIPAQDVRPVDASYEISANGLWGGKFEFPEKSQLISGVCYISVSSSCQLNKPITVVLEHCANIIDEKQAGYLSFVVAKCGPPFKFEYLPGGSFCPGSQYGTIHVNEFSLLAIVLCSGAVFATFGVIHLAMKKPDCFYQGQVFYNSLNAKTSHMNFAVTQDFEYSKVIRNISYFHKNNLYFLNLIECSRTVVFL